MPEHGWGCANPGAVTGGPCAVMNPGGIGQVAPWQGHGPPCSMPGIMPCAAEVPLMAVSIEGAMPLGVEGTTIPGGSSRLELVGSSG